MATNLTSITGNIKLNVNVTSQKVDTFPSTPNDPITWSDNQVVTFGSVAYASDQVFRINGTVSTTSTLDLTTGGLYNSFGQQINLNALNTLIIKNTSTADDLVVQAGSYLTVTLTPGGVVYLTTDGISTSDIVLSESGSGDATYEAIIIGRQA